jgi:hypothetical protein
MPHTDDDINAIIDSAMKIHRDRGNADLSDDAKSEIRGWLRDNSDQKLASGLTKTQLETAIANAVGRAQRFQSHAPAGPIAGAPMKAALSAWHDNNGRDPG